MRPNQKNRYNGRYNTRNYRPQQMIFRNTALDSNGPCGKLHGTPLQLFEKYQNASKDALLQNDSVLAETCLQFADHYMRLQIMAIENEESMRPNKTQQNKQPENANIADELPNFDVPVISQEASAESLSAEDEAIKNMDLSIPILAIQEKHLNPATSTGTQPSAKQNKPQGRRMHKPRQPVAQPSETPVSE